MQMPSKTIEKHFPLFLKLKRDEIQKIENKYKNNFFLYHKDNDNVLFKEYDDFNEVSFKIFNNHYDFDIEDTINKIITENKKYIDSYFVEGRILFYEDYMAIDNIVCNIKFKDVLIDNLIINLKNNYFSLNFLGSEINLKNKVRMTSDKYDLFWYYLRLLIKKEDAINEVLMNISDNSNFEPILKISNLIKNKEALNLIKILNYD